MDKISALFIFAFVCALKVTDAFTLPNPFSCSEACSCLRADSSLRGNLRHFVQSSKRDIEPTTLRMASKAQPPFKGFGKAPEGPPSRTPSSADELCVCESGKKYQDCCQPFHTGQTWPSTPEQLMRSRLHTRQLSACYGAHVFGKNRNPARMETRFAEANWVCQARHTPSSQTPHASPQPNCQPRAAAAALPAAMGTPRLHARRQQCRRTM